jgi:hypothetical protein
MAVGRKAPGQEREGAAAGNGATWRPEAEKGLMTSRKRALAFPELAGAEDERRHERDRSISPHNVDNIQGEKTKKDRNGRRRKERGKMRDQNGISD